MNINSVLWNQTNDLNRENGNTNIKRTKTKTLRMVEANPSQFGFGEDLDLDAMEQMVNNVLNDKHKL